MRLLVTDKFLWSVYKFLETVGDVVDASEIFKLRSLRDIGPKLGDEYWRNLQKRKERKQFAQLVNYLKTKGYINIANLKEKRGILLTPKGKRKALRVEAGLVEKKRRKDKKWIMIMYDIPERKKKERTMLRETLQRLGYKCLQKSIWVCPFDVFKETEEIIRAYALDSYVRIFLIEEVTL